ncbi:MAG: hypothetical protein A3F18_00445 [Legionellales bacterium RIFCSPHIGHO2_12_FULL_37_14]|nr:MAG: hypothetical protein A3F18_00445 [Legionellales bacterium RIFCSPHIGHO2_12_FULL_37_14]
MPAATPQNPQANSLYKGLFAFMQNLIGWLFYYTKRLFAYLFSLIGSAWKSFLGGLKALLRINRSVTNGETEQATSTQSAASQNPFAHLEKKKKAKDFSKKPMLAIGTSVDEPLDVQRFSNYCQHNNLIWVPNTSYFENNQCTIPFVVTMTYADIVKAFIKAADKLYVDYIRHQSPQIEYFHTIMIDRCVINFFRMDDVFFNLPIVKHKQAQGNKSMALSYRYKSCVDRVAQVLLFERLLLRLENDGELIIDIDALTEKSELTNEFINLLAQYFTSVKPLEDKHLRIKQNGKTDDGLEHFMVFKGFKRKELKLDCPKVLENLPQYLPEEENTLQQNHEHQNSRTPKPLNPLMLRDYT